MPTRPFSVPADLPSGESWHRSALEWMGGPDVLSPVLPHRAEAGAALEIGSDLGWVKAVEEGLPTEALDAAVEQGVLSWSDVQELVLPRRTLSHRKQGSGRLTPEESDRLLRLLRTIAEAEEAFQSEEKARRWLRKPNRALGGEVPFELLRTAGGARLVEEVLGRIAHGVYS